MRGVTWAVLIACVLVAEPAQAVAEEDDRSKALALSERSVEAYRAGRFEDSVELLTAARRLHRAPVLLYNLARAYEALGRLTEAADAYASYLVEESEAPDRGAIEGRITTLRAQATELAKAKETPARQAPPPSRGSELTVVPWILVGVGAVTLGAGAGLGLAAQAGHDDAVDEPVQTASRDAQDGAEGLARASTICFVAGGTIAAIGLGWLGIRAFTSSSSSSSSRAVSFSATPTSIGLSGTF